jgi:hypothetical protein
MRQALARAGLEGAVDPNVWERRWTVHIQQIGTGEHAALYLSRYIYRVALTNHRLESFAHGRVTFRYTHARTHETRRVTLPVNVFLARFLQHVLPRGFTKIRSSGLLSPASRPALEHARELLRLHSVQSFAQRDDATAGAPITGTSATAASASDLRCPVCRHGHLQFVARYRRSRAPPLTCPTSRHALRIASAAA